MGTDEAIKRKTLALQSRPFALDTTAYLRAAAGAPAWSRGWSESSGCERTGGAIRKRRRNSLGRWSSVRGGNSAARARTASVDLTGLNELIDKHNAFYPIEARLWDRVAERTIRPSPPGLRYPLPHVTAGKMCVRSSDVRPVNNVPCEAAKSTH